MNYPFRAKARSDQPGASGDGGGLAPVRGSEFGKNVGDVPVGRAAADEELGGDLGIGQALTEKAQDFTLAGGQERIGARRLQRKRQAGIAQTRRRN
jgi:hypothetical protein